jgi:eukaryotic-like serine/threonine-protein kinase
VTLNRKDRLVFEGPGALTLWDIASDGRVLLTLDEERRAVRAKAPGEGAERDLSLLDQTGVQAISRDGRKILGGDRFGLFIRATDGSSLTEYRGDAFADDLAPDGTTILATTDNYHKQIVISPGKSVPQALPPGGIIRYGGAYWFPQSRRVLITGQRDREEQRSFVQDIAGGAPTPITDPGTWGVAISQDEQWIAAIQGPRPPVRILPINVGAAPPKIVPGVEDGERPMAFSQDGKALWLFRRGKIPGNVYKVEIATGRRDGPITLDPPDTAGVYSIVDVAITPDGKAYAYSYTRVLSELYLAKGLK